MAVNAAESGNYNDSGKEGSVLPACTGASRSHHGMTQFTHVSQKEEEPLSLIVPTVGLISVACLRP